MNRCDSLVFPGARMVLLVFVGCSTFPQNPAQDIRADQEIGSVPFDINRCPDGTHFLNEYGTCAPIEPICEPWEMPTFDGRCIPVGPRACPTVQDAPADSGCEPGTLLTCKEGFVLTGDEVACIPDFDANCDFMEIPVLGGGCQEVGPSWDAEGEPFFEECAEGFIALPGGSCELIGPRGCAKLWDPDSDVDCEIGDILPCPKGWMEGEGGLLCEPVFDECGPGERSLPGGGCQRLVPLPEDCPSGPFPSVPEGAGPVVYVSADSSCTQACGSIEAPYPSVQDAANSVAAGGTILIGPGVYPGPVVERPLSIVGLCAPMVIFTGAEVPDAATGNIPAAVWILNTSEVSLGNISIQGESIGISIENTEGFSLDHIDCFNNPENGIAVGLESIGTIHRSWIHNTNSGEGSEGPGRGLHLSGGSIVAVQETLIESVSTSGVFANSDATEVSLEGCTIRNVRANGKGEFGTGVQVQNGGQVSISDCLLENNVKAGAIATKPGTSLQVLRTVLRDPGLPREGFAGKGVLAFDGSHVEISNCLIDRTTSAGVMASNSGTEIQLVGTVIRNTRASGPNNFGRGILALDRSRIESSGCLVEGSTGFGAYADDLDTKLNILGTTIRDTRAHEEGSFGCGIGASGGCQVMLSRSLVEKNVAVGIQAQNLGTNVSLIETVLRDTKPAEVGSLGRGVAAYDACRVELTACLVDRNSGMAIYVSEPGTKLSIHDTMIRDTLPMGRWFGRAVHSWNEGHVEIFSSVLEGNTEYGVFTSDPGTEVFLTNSTIRDTRPNKAGFFGRGVNAQNGSLIEMTRSMIEGSSNFGVTSFGPNTRIALTGTVIRNTAPAVDGAWGRGVHAQGGSQVDLVDCIIDDNAESGVFSTDSETEVTLIHSIVRNTKPNENGLGGRGINAQADSQMTLSGCLVDGNSEAGVSAFGLHTSVTLADTLIRNTKPNSVGELGRGIDVWNGARLDVTDCLVEDNRNAGLAGGGIGTSISLERTVIRNTQADNMGQGGWGAFGYGGCETTISNSLIDGNTWRGVVGAHPTTDTHLKNAIVRNTQLTASGEEGVGVLIAWMAEAEVHQTLVTGNHSVGLVTLSPGTMATVSDSAVLDTRGGGAWVPQLSGETEFQVYGDGVLVSDGGQLDLARSVVARNARTGIYFSQSSGSVLDNTIFLNESYGLAMDLCAADVEHMDSGNRFIGNAWSLPPDFASEIAINPQGLPVTNPKLFLEGLVE